MCAEFHTSGDEFRQLHITNGIQPKHSSPKAKWVLVGLGGTGFVVCWRARRVGGLPLAEGGIGGVVLLFFANL